MALNGKFISFEPIIESAYRRAGYQTIDWAQAIEVIGETIGLIGALPAYKNITTNGSDSNPLEVEDFRVALPSDLVVFQGVRKIELTEDSDGNLSISGFSPMYENSDLYYKSNRNQWNDAISTGTYDYSEFKQRDYILLSGSSGTATITKAGGLTKTVTFDTDLETTASNFVTSNEAAYLVEGIVLSSDGDYIILTSEESGTDFTSPAITNASGDLSGTVTSEPYSDPVIVYGPALKKSFDYEYQYKVDNGYIYTNFETGFLELSYKGFITDDHGFPKIPDDPKWIEAVRWSIIEFLDYKKWRVGEITDKVYQKSEQEKLFYVAAARSKSDIPSLGKMESMKNMFLRSIIHVNEYSNYFKNSNVGERRYTQNDPNRGY